MSAHFVLETFHELCFAAQTCNVGLRGSPCPGSQFRCISCPAVGRCIAAVQAGASHVQCTANGYGERAGNADLFAVVGNLVTKLGITAPPYLKLEEEPEPQPHSEV